MKNDSHPRLYRQTARAQAAEDTGNRILDAFVTHFRAGWFEEIRLDDIAREAGVTVQTVIRRFGGKEGLLEASANRMEGAILGERSPAATNVGTAVDILISEYDQMGGLMMRMLSQEERYPAIHKFAERGRAMHRQWVGEVFAPWLARIEEPRRRDVHDRLVIAFDLYVWKLIRVDMKRSREALREAMLGMAAAALGIAPGQLEG